MGLNGNYLRDGDRTAVFSLGYENQIIPQMESALRPNQEGHIGIITATYKNPFIETSKAPKTPLEVGDGKKNAGRICFLSYSPRLPRK